MAEKRYIKEPHVEKLIHEIIRNFDFHKVHRYMESVNWTWRNEGVPSVSMMKKQAVQLLREVAYEDCSCASTGGFMAQAYGKECVGQLSLHLYFILTFWEAEEG